MQVSITFEVDNAVFEDWDGGGLDLSEVADTLRRCADRIEDGDRPVRDRVIPSGGVNTRRYTAGLSIRQYPAGGYSSGDEDQEQRSPVRHTRFPTWCRTPVPPLRDISRRPVLLKRSESRPGWRGGSSAVT